MIRFRLLAPGLAILLTCTAAVADSSFSYQVDVTPNGYRLNTAMKFSPGVRLIQVVHDFRSLTLLSQLNPVMEAGRVIEKDAEHYDLILSFKILGISFEMLSHCSEKTSPDGSRWDRDCVLDPAVRDAPKFMNSKSDVVHCEQPMGQGADRGSVLCEMKVEGSLKKIPFLNPGKLSVKAKFQSLVNWGKFWTYADAGSISSSDSNRIFDRSGLKINFDRLLSDGLKQASEMGSDFHLQRSGHFENPDIADITHPPQLSPPSRTEADLKFKTTIYDDPRFQLGLDQATGTELTRNSDVRLHENGEALSAILRVIENARKFALVEVLSLTCDSSTEPLIRLLESKSKSGVDVRILTHRMYALLDSSCIRRLEKSGVAVARGPVHASYFVNDQSELVIGSESVARMFFESDGTNFLDRDMMLEVRGPVATDALRDFLSVWDENRTEGARDISDLSGFYRTQRRKEIDQKLRSGAQNYRSWLGSSQPGLCRFASQKPGGRERAMEYLLREWIRSAREKIFFSGVKMDPDSPWVIEARAKAQRGVNVDFLTNGWRGGNGELTMLLDEWVAHLQEMPLSGFGLAPVLARLRDWDRDRLLKRNLRAEKEILGPPSLRIHSYFSFAHYKAWSVDHYGVWLGSANPDRDAITENYEAGVLCIDSSLARDFEAQTKLDLSNTVPVRSP